MKKSIDFLKEYYPKNWAEIERISINDTLDIVENVIEYYENINQKIKTEQGLNNMKIIKKIVLFLMGVTVCVIFLWGACILIFEPSKFGL